jgi:hypothetical protein
VTRRSGYTVQGVAKLRRELRRAGIKVEDLQAAHREIAAAVVEEAQRRAPVRTGRLRNSLKPYGYSASAVVRAAGRTVPYANPIHWGWGRRNIRANPFVLEAAESQWNEINNMYLSAIEAILDEIDAGGSTR